MPRLSFETHFTNSVKGVVSAPIPATLVWITLVRAIDSVSRFPCRVCPIVTTGMPHPNSTVNRGLRLNVCLLVDRPPCNQAISIPVVDLKEIQEFD